MENENVEQTMTQLAERLAAAAVQLERAIAGMEERHAHVCGDVQRIVATAEGAFGEQRDASRQELERKLAAAEQQIASLLAQAQASATATVRKTMTAQMISKRGVETVSSVEAGALDAALSGLSLEQRIAVKSQLARAGVLG
jgi:primosomal protein N''